MPEPDKSEKSDPDSATARQSGGCQCGAVRYRFRGPPLKVGICHCRMCQKASGGPFFVYAVVQLADFTWTRGTPASWVSSSVASRYFCAACGTPLAYRGDGSPRIEVFTGSLDQPERAIPIGQNGIESRLAWLDDLPRLPGKTTADNSGGVQAADVVSRQHPDHDTDDDWAY